MLNIYKQDNSKIVAFVFTIVAQLSLYLCPLPTVTTMISADSGLPDLPLYKQTGSAIPVSSCCLQDFPQILLWHNYHWESGTQRSGRSLNGIQTFLLGDYRDW